MLLKLENVNKKYNNYITGKEFYAAKNINIDIKSNEIVGLSGESGSGKSTIGQITSGLIDKTDGNIVYKDKEIDMPFKNDIRREIQIIFQHPELSFNPRMKIINSFKEAYKYSKRDFNLEDLLNRLKVFGIYKEHLDRYPDQLSGGELQRLSINRALLFNPELLILDEATSMLDPISQAQIINILYDYHKKNKISYLFISHDDLLLRKFCDKIYFIDNGEIIKKEETYTKFK